MDGRISLGGHVVFEDNTFAISPEMETELFDLFKASKRGKRNRACSSSTIAAATAVHKPLSSIPCRRKIAVAIPLYCGRR